MTSGSPSCVHMAPTAQTRPKAASRNLNIRFESKRYGKGRFTVLFSSSVAQRVEKRTLEACVLQRHKSPMEPVHHIDAVHQRNDDIAVGVLSSPRGLLGDGAYGGVSLLPSLTSFI